MRYETEHEQELRPDQLRALLTVARELLQADEPAHVHALAGRTMAELAQPRDGLLLVRDEGESAVAFDADGRAQPSGPHHPCYPAAAVRLGQRAGARDRQGGHVRGEHVLALGLPAHDAVVALAAAWDSEAAPGEWQVRRRILASILELMAAALGKIQARSSLQQLVSTQYERMVDTARAHADELARRDVAEDAMRLLALTDTLTGLNNRRGFFTHAEHVFRVAQRRHARSAVIFADIDDLKLINDGLGHETGDKLIRDAALVFRESFRDADVVARLGGDEFVAFTLDDAQPQAILARLRDNLRAFNLMQERPYQISISAGIVQCEPDDERNLFSYVQQADQHMYAHKRRRLH
jgi:diguanylate cyclase (GGDEF)-like protein